MRPWIATLRYKSKIGDEGEGGLGISVDHLLDDPGQLDAIIRNGPGWESLLWVRLGRTDDERFPAIPFEDVVDHSNEPKIADKPREGLLDFEE